MRKEILILFLLILLTSQALGQVKKISVSPANPFPKMSKDSIIQGYDISKTKPFPVLALINIRDVDISPAKPFPKRTAKLKIEGYDISPTKPLRKVSWSFKTIKQKLKYIA